VRQATRLLYTLPVVFAKCCICFAAVLAWSLPAARAQDVKKEAPVEDTILGDFEDGTTQTWYGPYGREDLIVEESEHARGKKWLRMVLKDAPWPGAWRTWQAGQDWSKCRALRFYVYNPNEENVPYHIRIDDVISHGQYSNRYNRNEGLTLKPGPNEFEVTIGSFKIGASGCRGLDTTNIHLLGLFIENPGHPVTLCLDDVRLVPLKKTDAEPLVLDDFEGQRTVPWQPQGDTVFRTVKRPDGGEGSALKLDLGTDGAWPGIQLLDLEGNWLDYDLFCVDVFCPEDQDTPGALAIRIKDKQGIEVKLMTGLKRGLNRVQVPLELAGYVALGKVTELSLYSLWAEKKQVCYLDNIRLERRPELIEGGTVHAEGEADAPLTIDFRGVEQVSAAFGSIVWIPLESGQTRVIRCTTPGPGPHQYSLSARMLEGRDPKKPIQIWAYYRAALDQFWTHTEVTAEGKEPIKVRFDDPKRFAR